MIMRFNRADKNISFPVPSATILFIDIEKLSNYNTNLSSPELMHNVGEKFMVYDMLLSKYPLIFKFTFIGDH
jgi:hypothetical protein